jgi:CubicO group peptidase (beta-lactamase class C family)
MTLARSVRALVPLVAALSAAPALASDPASGALLADRLDRLAARLESERVKYHIPGMAIAIVMDDEIVFARGFGVADVDTGAPVTNETRFAVGSTTKAFTATLIGMLVDEGRMSWDDPVSRHVPYYHLTDAEADAQVVIRDLLCHRIGFASAASMLWYGNDVTSEEVLRTLLQAELLHPFRQKWNYCNISFLAAGMAAESASGAGWHALVAERIFAPLGMEQSNTTLPAAHADPLMAKGYVWDEDDAKLVHQPMRDIAAVAPAGAINSSARDMAQWVRFQLARGAIGGKRLISEEQHAQTWTAHSTVSPGIDYGLGWFLREWKGRREIDHAGGIDGFTAEVALLPDERIGFVLLMSLFAAPLQEASRGIVFDALLSEQADPAGATEDFAPYVGTYLGNFAHFEDAEFEVLVQGGALAIDVPGQMVFELAAPGEDGKRPFALTDTIAVRFNGNEDGGVRSLTIFQAGLEFELPRKGVAQPALDEVDRAEVARYLGRYRSEESGMECTVLVRNGRLAVDVPGQMVYELRAPDADGRRRFAVKDTISVAFAEEAGRVAAMTLTQDGIDHTLPYFGNPAADGLPTADEVMARVHDATGAAHLSALGGFRARGTVRFVHMGVEGTFALLAAGGGRQRSHMDLGRFGHVIVAADGTRAWVDSSAMTEELDGEVLEDLMRHHPFAIISDWRSAYRSIEVAGAEEHEGRPAWVVRLEPAGAPTETLYVHRESGLPLALVASPMTASGVRIETTYAFDDWRPVGGVRIAHRMETKTELTGTIVVELEVVEPDAAIPAEEFVLRQDAEPR